MPIVFAGQGDWDQLWSCIEKAEKAIDQAINLAIKTAPPDCTQYELTLSLSAHNPKRTEFPVTKEIIYPIFIPSR